MRYALFTTQFILPVDDEDEAETIAREADASAELNLLAVLEQEDVTADQARQVRLLKTSVALFDSLPELRAPI